MWLQAPKGPADSDMTAYMEDELQRTQSPRHRKRSKNTQEAKRGTLYLNLTNGLPTIKRLCSHPPSSGSKDTTQDNWPIRKEVIVCFLV